MSFMTYDEIGADIGITKQAVSQNVKRGVNKVFDYIYSSITKNPFDALSMLVVFLNIDNHDDFTQMYKLIKNESKKLIEDTKEWTRGY